MPEPDKLKTTEQWTLITAGHAHIIPVGTLITVLDRGIGDDGKAWAWIAVDSLAINTDVESTELDAHTGPS